MKIKIEILVSIGKSKMGKTQIMIKGRYSWALIGFLAMKLMSGDL